MVEAARGLPVAVAPARGIDAQRGAASFAEALARAAADDGGDAAPGRAAADDGGDAAPGRAASADARDIRSARAARGPDELRPAVAALLERLARRAEPALAAALARASAAWDQADSFFVIDGDLEAEIAVTRRRLTAAAAPAEAATRRALALEGLLAVDATVALVRVFERRLAALLRLRLRSATPELLPGGRPFLDLGRALHEVAGAWR